MEKIPQEIIEKIIDHVHYVDLKACSLVGRRWAERSHWRMWGSGYCWFIDRRRLDSWRTRLLTTGSIFVERTHTLTLNSTAVRAWGEHFRDVDLVLPQLKSLTIANARLRPSDVATLKRNFGNTLLSLSLNRVSIRARQFYHILSSFPNLDNLSIVGLDLSQPPSGNIPACPRTQGKLTLVGEEAHSTCVPFLLELPVQFRTLYFYDTVGIEQVHPLVCACSSTLESLEIRGSVCFFPAASINPKRKEIDDVPRIGGWETPLTPQDYPELQSICFTLAALVTPRSFVALVLSSIVSAPKLSEISFIFTWTTLDQDIDITMNLTAWGLVDDQLCRLAQQATGRLTASFDFLTEPGWTPRKDDTGMNFMWRFRRFGVMKLRSFGEDMATYYPRP